MRNKAVVVLLTFLVVFCGITYFFMRGQISGDESGLVIKAAGEETGILNYDELCSLQSKEFTYKMRINGNKEVHQFTGTPLKEVLQKCDPSLLKDYKKVIVTAVDGYTISYQMSEVLQDNNIYLIYAMDGERLKPKDKGGIGPFGTVVLKDEFPKRAGKYVVNVEVLQ